MGKRTSDDADTAPHADLTCRDSVRSRFRCWYARASPRSRLAIIGGRQSALEGS